MSGSVHANHCCNEHGCKYSNRDCPVVVGVIDQKYPCEQCSDSDREEGAVVKTWEQAHKEWSAHCDPVDGTYPPDRDDDTNPTEGWWVDLLDDRGCIVGGGKAHDVHGLVEFYGPVQVGGIVTRASVFKDGLLMWHGETNSKRQVSAGQHILMTFDIKIDPF